jgi:hypothetical protein
MQEKLNGNGAGDPKRGSAAARGRPFRPGQSGNPAGRPRGARDVATRLVEALTQGEAEEIARKAVDLAKEGDSRIVKALLDRLAPAPRARFVPFALPPLDAIEDVPKATAALIAGVAEGEITPGEAAELARLVDAHIRAIELAELEERLAALEGRIDA